MIQTIEDNYGKHSNSNKKKQHFCKYWYKKLKFREVSLSTQKKYKYIMAHYNMIYTDTNSLGLQGFG